MISIIKKKRKGAFNEVFFALTSLFLIEGVVASIRVAYIVANYDSLHFNFNYLLTKDYLFLNLARV